MVTPVGLDIGTGFTKVSGLGKQLSFPSLYASRYTDGRTIHNMNQSKNILEECVGRHAIPMGESRTGTMIRPVKHGLPCHDKGYSKLTTEALSLVGISNISDAYIVAGVTFDAKSGIKRIKRIIKSLKPHMIKIVPQAYGTMTYCNKKSGTVVNIGHGTTEVIHIKSGVIEGSSIPKASNFVTDQLDKTRGSYVNYKKLFSQNESLTQKLVYHLAEHIADEVTRIASHDNIILAGGGSLLPGMRENLEKILYTKTIVPDNPVFSNAIGLEMIAKTMVEQAEPKTEHTSVEKIL